MEIQSPKSQPVRGGTGEHTLSRRSFLAGTGAAAAIAAAGPLIAGCGGASGASSSKGSPYPLARPNHPVTWPIAADNKPIASGLSPERGATLKIYNWAAYLNPQVISNFCKKYRCKAEVTTYGTMPEGVEKLRSGELAADVFFPRIDVLGQLQAARLLRPLNHSYIPNIAQAWPEFSNPFYDAGWRYTIPYTVYTTGMTWRKDYVHEDPYRMANAWAMPWQAKYKGKVAVLDDYREGISLGLLKNHIYNLNASSAAQIAVARSSLAELISLVNVHVDLNDFSNVPSGQIWIHEAFSGDMASAAAYMPKGVSVDVIGYWFPPDNKGPVGNDTVTIPRSGQNPVLAHLFLNYLLEVSNALENTSYIGYMQPLNAVTADLLVTSKILPPSLVSTAVTPAMLSRGLRELELAPAVDAEWEQAWQEFSGGL
jgi:spermidine/putrescine transport system substrate-binding protein